MVNGMPRNGRIPPRADGGSRGDRIRAEKDPPPLLLPRKNNEEGMFVAREKQQSRRLRSLGLRFAIEIHVHMYYS